LWTQFGEVFDKISEDGTVRAVVLASSIPRFFTAGLDLNETSGIATISPDPARRAFVLRQHILRFQHAISAVERCPFPVIAAVHGFALGLAIDIITACDIRYAASDAVFAVKEVDIGLAADIGTLARLPKVAANQSLVRELAFTARNFSADEALSLGLLSKVIQGTRREVVGAALETAKVIAGKSPVAVLGTKHLLVHARDHSVPENLEYTAAWNAAALQTSDPGDAIAAVKAKRQPKFAVLPKLTGKL
ncbi:ClpP/crotonase, partial [Rickenella mellea]